MSESILCPDKELREIEERVELLENAVRARAKNSLSSVDDASMMFYILDSIRDTKRLLKALKVAQRKLILNSI